MTEGGTAAPERAFVWFGEGPSPLPELTAAESMQPSVDAAAVLVSGELDPSRAIAAVRELLGEPVPVVVMTSPTGAAVEEWISSGACTFLAQDAEPGIMMAVLSGVAELAGRAAELNPLTGLPGNRTITEVLRRRVLEGTELVAYIDISGFKPFNDYYGFARGDAVLRMLSSLLIGNLGKWFVGHIGGDDFVAVGPGEEFRCAAAKVARMFSSRATGFYGTADRSRGGIEALDRHGSFRFYPFMALTVSILSGEGCGSLGRLAARAGALKKRVAGEEPPLTVSAILHQGGGEPSIEDLEEWTGAVGADTLFTKALLEASGILGDSRMIPCLISVLEGHPDRFVRKSAARALGMLPGPDTSEALKGSMNDPSRHVRTTSTAAIPMAMGVDAGPLLEAALEDSCTWVRRAALRGLGISGWDGAAELLGRFLREGPPGDRSSLDRRKELEAALEGAAILGERALAPLMMPYLKSSGGVSPGVAWEALMTLGGIECLERMLQSLDDDGSPVFIQWLERFRVEGLPEGALQRLELLLVERLRGSAEDIGSILGFIHRLPHVMAPSTREVLDGILLGGADPTVVELVLGTLIARNQRPAGGEIHRLLAGPGGRLSRKGLLLLLRWAALGRGGITRSFLEQLLRHPSRETRTAAARTVTSMASDRRQDDHR